MLKALKPMRRRNMFSIISQTRAVQEATTIEITITSVIACPLFKCLMAFKRHLRRRAPLRTPETSADSLVKLPVQSDKQINVLMQTKKLSTNLLQKSKPDLNQAAPVRTVSSTLTSQMFASSTDWEQGKLAILDAICNQEL